VIVGVEEEKYRRRRSYEEDGERREVFKGVRVKGNLE
jgi:hypothetical protein